MIKVTLDFNDIMQLQKKFVAFVQESEPDLDFSMNDMGTFRDYRVLELWVLWFRACLSTVQLINRGELDG